ncbi:MAG: MFS transporter, partial [Anaerovorax sp.]
AYWQLIPAIIYDMCEIYEYKYGERREGAVTALCIFAVKVGSALALQTLGLILSLNGYNASVAVQSDQAIMGIENAFTLIPGIILLAAVVVLFIFPVTKKSYNLLLHALEEKRKGNVPNEEGLERLV